MTYNGCELLLNVDAWKSLFFAPIVRMRLPEYAETYCSSGDNSVLSSTNNSTMTNFSLRSVATLGSVHTLASILRQFTQFQPVKSMSTGLFNAFAAASPSS